MEICAPGITAPVASVTAPLIVPDAVWAKPALGLSRTNARTGRTTRLTACMTPVSHEGFRLSLSPGSIDFASNIVDLLTGWIRRAYPNALRGTGSTRLPPRESPVPNPNNAQHRTTVEPQLSTVNILDRFIVSPRLPMTRATGLRLGQSNLHRGGWQSIWSSPRRDSRHASRMRESASNQTRKRAGFRILPSRCSAGSTLGVRRRRAIRRYEGLVANP